MRVRVFFLISIVLNVALAAAFLGWFVPKREAARFVRPINTGLVYSNGLRIVKTNVLVRPRLFNWQEVEAADYPTYIDNLRGIGMPEPTIRDIIIADVDQLFIRKRRELASQQDIEWWRSQPSADFQSNALARAFRSRKSAQSCLPACSAKIGNATVSISSLIPCPLPVPF